MAGPDSPNHPVGTGGPTPRNEPSGEPPTFEFPHSADGGDPGFAPAGAVPPSGPYPGQPGQLPQAPAPYPTTPRPKRRLIIGTLVAIALVAALTVAIVYGVRTNGANTGGAFSETAAKSAIQGYLNALERRDIDYISRNALCGIYDGVRDRRADENLAKINSDAFRKQFSEAEVTSVDKIVYLSQYQAQALFTMHVSSATSGSARRDVQALAQLLLQRNQILVCSWIPRTAATY